MSPARWLVAALAAQLALALAGCGSASSPTDVAPADHPGSTAAAPIADQGSPLEGTWTTGPLTLAQTVTTLRRNGLARWATDYRRNAPLADGAALSLTITGGAWNLYGQVGDGPAEPIDYDADYEISGDTVTFHHSDGSTTYRWAVLDDTLTLEYATSTMPDYRGIPDEVFQRALYTTSTFTRQD